MQTAQWNRICRIRYFHCYLKMHAPRALVFRPLVKGNEALGTGLHVTLNAFSSPVGVVYLSRRGLWTEKKVTLHMV